MRTPRVTNTENSSSSNIRKKIELQISLRTSSIESNYDYNIATLTNSDLSFLSFLFALIIK
jgi:hypothetical protein